MTFLLWAALGLVAGLAGMLAAYRRVPRGPAEWLAAAIVGVVGGWVGGWLLGVAGVEALHWIGSVLLAFLASWGVLAAFRRSALEAPDRRGRR
jgi:uncharacterized membrane protein YeaQ/YmgE (transglycosylase-associated protein family)